MSNPVHSKAQGYDSFYKEFDSALMRQVRREAYGEDIGQHSWVTAEELRANVSRLQLARSSRFLDLGCGPCGPLTHICCLVGCRGTGTDLSAAALAAGLRRAASLGVDDLIELHEADLDQPVQFATGSFDAVMSLDVVLHLHDRAQLFLEVARILAVGGRFLFTDAGVITGSISDQEVLRRSVHGHTQFVAPGFNERMLESAGLRLLGIEDRTDSTLKNASGRLAAILAHRMDLEQLTSTDDFDRQKQYLETVIELSRRGALSRIMYLAESRAS